MVLGGGDGSKERAYPSGYNVVPTSIPPFFFHFTRQKILIFFLSPQQMTVETDAMYSSDSDFISDDGGDAPFVVSSEEQTSASQIKVWKLKVKGLKGVVKRHRSTSPFRHLLLSQFGLQVVEAEKNKSGRPQSKCAKCNCVHANLLDWWKRHAKKQCTNINAQADVFHKACAVGGEKHRRRNCDAHVITYWIYKNKVPFTHGSKLQEV